MCVPIGLLFAARGDREGKVEGQDKPPFFEPLQKLRPLLDPLRARRATFLCLQMVTRFSLAEATLGSKTCREAPVGSRIFRLERDVSVALCGLLLALIPPTILVAGLTLFVFFSRLPLRLPGPAGTNGDRARAAAAAAAAKRGRRNRPPNVQQQQQRRRLTPTFFPPTLPRWRWAWGRLLALKVIFFNGYFPVQGFVRDRSHDDNWMVATVPFAFSSYSISLFRLSCIVLSCCDPAGPRALSFLLPPFFSRDGMRCSLGAISRGRSSFLCLVSCGKRNEMDVPRIFHISPICIKVPSCIYL